MKNIVLDTNIVISALLKSTNCVKILNGLKEDKFILTLSEKLIEETMVIAGNSKFAFTESEKTELRELLVEKARLVSHEEEISVCRDPKDNIVLECAVAGKSNFIVTGDADLLSLKKFRGIRILTPKQFSKYL